MADFRSICVMGVAVFGALLALPGQAQQVQITPNPAPINGKITVTGAGFTPNVPISVYWDQQQPQTLQSNIVFVNHPRSDNNGAFTFTVDLPVLHVYPAWVGQHSLTFLWVDPNIGTTRTTTVGVNLTSRTGWSTPAALPTQATNGLAPGTLAFLRYNGDKTATSLVASNGQTERVLGIAPVSNFQFSQPDWSPDGTRIAFSTVFDTFPHHNTYVLDVTNGTVSQATDLGGTPPRLTGGGTGSITGAILPYIQRLPTAFPDPGEDHCNGIIKGAPPDPNTGQSTLALFPEWPLSGRVTLIGTGIKATATLPPGAQKGDAMTFAIPNVPAGEYSLHMYHDMVVCQEVSRSTLVDPNGGGGARIIRSWIRAGSIPSATVTVRVNPGQNTTVQPVRMIGGSSQATSPTWLANDRLVYDLSSRTFEIGGSSNEEIWTVRMGQAPVQHSQWVTHSHLSHPDASPTDGIFAGVSSSAKGLFFAEPSNIIGTAGILTNWQAIATATGGSAVVSDHWPSWDPNGSHIAFVRLSSLSNLQVGNIWIHEVATGGEWPLTNFNLAQGEGTAGRPAWSPDRSQLAFTYTNDNLQTHNVRILNMANGTMLTLTTDGKSGYPSWAAARPVESLPSNVLLEPRIAGGPIVKLGDIDDDGQLTVADAVKGLRIIVGLEASPSSLLQKGDMDQNGGFNVTDVTLILRAIVGLSGA